MAKRSTRRKPVPELPPIDAAILLLGVGLEAEREIAGMSACLHHGIGRMRHKLGALTDAPIVGLDEDVRALESARRSAAALLVNLCEKCPYDCPAKRW